MIKGSLETFTTLFQLSKLITLNFPDTSPYTLKLLKGIVLDNSPTLSPALEGARI